MPRVHEAELRRILSRRLAAFGVFFSFILQPLSGVWSPTATSAPATGYGKCAAGSSGLASMRGMMEVEYRVAVRMVAAPDFIEGVRCSARRTVTVSC